MPGVVIDDLDREGLVEHFAIESEAKSLRDWVSKSEVPRPEGWSSRLAVAQRRKEEGNVAYGKEEWPMAVWLYLAALHALDYSKKDKVKDDIDVQVWQKTVCVILSNMAAAFGAKDDAYNAIRAADLGLGFAEKLGNPTLRAKLLYRRGLAKEKKGDDAIDDVAAALKLHEDRTMQATLRRLKQAAKSGTPAFNDLRGVFGPPKIDESPPPPNKTTTSSMIRHLGPRLSRTAVLGSAAVLVWLVVRPRDPAFMPSSKLKVWLIAASLVAARCLQFFFLRKK